MKKTFSGVLSAAIVLSLCMATAFAAGQTQMGTAFVTMPATYVLMWTWTETASAMSAA